MGTVTAVRTDQTVVKIDREGATVVIGERINPTNKEQFSQELLRGDLAMVVSEALKQAEEGAAIIDVNVGVSGVNERELLPAAVQAVIEATGLPVAVDSSDPEAIACALKACSGRQIINSATAEESSLDLLLPVAKEHNAVLIGLCKDESGIPHGTRQRLRLAEKILNRALEAGLSREDVIIDPIINPAAVDQQAASTALEGIRLIRDELGLNMTMGASNISFGFPKRELLNAYFLVLAVHCGVNVPILNPASRRIWEAIRCADLFQGCDPFGRRYLEFYRKTLAAEKA